MTPTDELLLIVRRPPGRGHLYRFRGPIVTAGADPQSALHLPDAPFALRFERGDGGWRAVEAGGARPVGDADAVTVGPYLIEITVDHTGEGPTTDRHESERLAQAIEAERRVRAADGPSIWVLRGASTGQALPIGDRAVSCGSGPDDDLRLGDGAIEPGHFTLIGRGGGRVQLDARRPVRVRGVEVTEATLELGDLVFVGRAVLELRTPGHEGELPVGPPAMARPRWPARLAAALFALAVAALGVAWWGWRASD